MAIEARAFRVAYTTTNVATPGPILDQIVSGGQCGRSTQIVRADISVFVYVYFLFFVYIWI